MSLLNARNLRKTIGEKVLVADANLGIAPNDRVGIIGANGCGKSTLLKILAGVEPADGGVVSLRQGTTIAYALQNPDFPAGATVLEYLFARGTPVERAVRGHGTRLDKSGFSGRTTGGSPQEAGTGFCRHGRHECLAP
jgi:ATP-binding cassette subfamily F protein uup